MAALRQLARRALATSTSAQPSLFASTPLGPPDAILGVTEAYKRSTNPSKINLGVGAYRDADGHPYVLPSVRAAERQIADRNMNMEYLPVSGLRSFVEKSVRLAYGGRNRRVEAGEYAGIQTLSGTGACRVGGELVSRCMERSGGGKALVLVPDPTWANHHAIFRAAGCEVATYGYYDAARGGVDVARCLADLRRAPAGSVVLLHATAHNPTGCDLSLEEWADVLRVVRERGLQCLFDSAYQGFTSGDADVDAAAIRLAADMGCNVLLAQSFSKNMGLYGHRVGCVSLLTGSRREASAVESQMQIIARAMWSNPPIAGVRIVDEVLGDAKLEAMWREDVRRMAGRIIAMRHSLVRALAEAGSTADWGHIVKQNGMFTYSGLSEAQVGRLADEWAVFLTGNGRISMAGVYESNVRYLARAMAAVSKGA
jgi:aspartate/tyrosine/aromatic aminotransferase